MTETKLNWRSIINPTLGAFKTYWHAILLIQCFALVVVISYYQLEGAASFFAWIADWKRNGGLILAATTTAIGSGLIPEIIKRLMHSKGRNPPGIGEFINQLAYWAILGIFVDLFYQFQAVLFGDGTAPGTLLRKVLFDQLVWSPLFTMPFTTLWFMVWESGYNKARFMAAFSLPIFIRRVLEIWTLCLCFWPIMLLIVYSLPQVLQFPLFLFGSAAHSILMIFIVRRQKADESPSPG